MRKAELAELTLSALKAEFPIADCTLDREEEFPERLVIRGILSAQCTDVRVNLTCNDLFAKLPTMEDIDNCSEEEVAELIKPCGLHKSKSKSIKAFADKFVNSWDHKVPQDVKELMTVPGVGKKIANLIVGEVYGIPALVVDTHCKRVMKRIGLTTNTDPLKVEADVCKLFDSAEWIDLGHRAVLLGRTYCKSQNPACDECPLREFCRRKI